MKTRELTGAASVSSIWTRFYDMHSGGGNKLGPEIIWIEASEPRASFIFAQVFGRDPNNIACECCCADYSISEDSDPKFNDGDWIITSHDIERFAAGSHVPFLAPFVSKATRNRYAVTPK